MNLILLRRLLGLFGLISTVWAAEPRNLSALKQEIVAYVDSGEYAAGLRAAV